MSPGTCTATLFFRLTLRMGSKEQGVVDGKMEWSGRKGKKAIPLASGEVEPLFIWRERGPLEWLTPRTELVRDVPKPPDTIAAAELAFATAREFGAIAVQGEAEYDPKTLRTRQVTYFAITSFVYVGTESAESRAKACKELTWRLLRDLSSTLIDEFPRYGSAGARQYAYRVSDYQAVIAATARYYAHDTPVQAALEGLADRLGAWSLRAAIPTDEALRVAAEIGAEAKTWKR